MYTYETILHQNKAIDSSFIILFTRSGWCSPASQSMVFSTWEAVIGKVGYWSWDLLHANYVSYKSIMRVGRKGQSPRAQKQSRERKILILTPPTPKSHTCFTHSVRLQVWGLLPALYPARAGACTQLTSLQALSCLASSLQGAGVTPCPRC